MYILYTYEYRYIINLLPILNLTKLSKKNHDTEAYYAYKIRSHCFTLIGIRITFTQKKKLKLIHFINIISHLYPLSQTLKILNANK